MVELWKANTDGWIDRFQLTAKELAATRKGKPIRGNYRALPLNQNYGYHEDYDKAVADLQNQMYCRIEQTQMHLEVWTAAVDRAQKAYRETVETYGQ